MATKEKASKARRRAVLDAAAASNASSPFEVFAQFMVRTVGTLS